ncbi:MAG: Gfo/Idh/MocA family protein [Acidimicrobiales bacterium]
MTTPIRVLLVGAGHMGTAHGRALMAIDGFDLCGIVTRGESGKRLARELGGLPHHQAFEEALAATRPDAVAIASFAETHVPFARAALEAGCHVFVEKPLADNVAEAAELIDLAKRKSRVLVVGYILRHHPSWQSFVVRARTLGKPLVMRMNLNQQSQGPEWSTHRSIMETTSPIVDCGVHYVDVMAQMTEAKATRVHAIGARLTDDLKPGMYNYGQLQITFEDGSIGWYEAGWGPMMSETAFFIKDVIGPNGALSIESGLEAAGTDSSDVNLHTITSRIRHHHSEVDDDAMLARNDDLIETADEPDHDQLCLREQRWFLQAIHGRADVAVHLENVLESLRIVLAADQSIRTGKVVELSA